MGGDSGRSRSLFATLIAVVIVSGAASFTGGYFLFQSTQSPPSDTLTVIDDLGRVVAVPLEVERIISLAPSVTEIVFELELESTLLAVDHVSDYPPEVGEMDLPRINTFPGVELETVIALNPDLVLAADIIAASDIDRISAQGIPVVVLGPKTIDGVLEDVLLVGLIMGKLATAQALVADLETRIATVIANTSQVAERPVVYLEFFPLWTFGPGSFGHDLIVMAGGRNAGASLTSMVGQVSNEFIIASNPDIVVYTVGPFTNTTTADIESRVGWDTIKAVQNGAIFSIDDNEVARGATRIVDALEDLARILHPDVFP